MKSYSKIVLYFILFFSFLIMVLISDRMSCSKKNDTDIQGDGTKIKEGNQTWVSVQISQNFRVLRGSPRKKRPLPCHHRWMITKGDNNKRKLDSVHRTSDKPEVKLEVMKHPHSKLEKSHIPQDLNSLISGNLQNLQRKDKS